MKMKIIKTVTLLTVVTGLLFVLAIVMNKYSVKEKLVASYERVRSETMDEIVTEPETVEKAETAEKTEITNTAENENDENAEPAKNNDSDELKELENKQMTDNIITKMSLHEKVCQMIVAWPEQVSNISAVQTNAAGMYEGLKKYPVGGIIYFADNLVNPDQTRKMIADTQKAANDIINVPLFICVDEEGGNTLRIATNPAFGLEITPAMATMTSEEEVKTAAKEIGRYLKDLGFNFDFAPDADVITNPLNQIIGSRSFGTDPQIVSNMSKAYSDGLHEAGILSSYKHFPGHGATEGDTHEGFAYTNKSMDELRAEDLISFESAGPAGADSVMVAHISLPTVLGDNTPCTLSKEIITDLLREELSFDGLIVTDALNMKAITNNYDPGQAAVMAVKAGSDIILMPLELETAVEAIKNAVLAGEIDEKRIDESVKRILAKKAGLGK